MNEIESIRREARRISKIRAESSPRDCFVIDHGYVWMFCDPLMAEQYYKRAEQRICLECYYWDDEQGCQKPFGLKHLIAIVRNVLWKLRWKWHLPPLDWLYCYHFRLMKRRSANVQQYEDEDSYWDEERILCSTCLPVICEHHRTLDDCGSEACTKYGHTWNTWNNEDGCEDMGEAGFSPYDKEDEEQ